MNNWPRGYRALYWRSPTHCVATNGTHLRDCYLARPTARSRFMAMLHRIAGKRDPFFYREDYP